MKRFLLFLLLITPLLSSAIAPSDASAWVGRPLTDNEVTACPWLVPCTIRGDQHVLVAHAWAKCTTPQLDINIPRGKIFQRWGKDLSNVTLRDFALSTFDLPLNKSVFSISACGYNADGVKTRYSYTDADALIDWVTQIAPFGIKLEDLLTDAEMEALLPITE